MKGCIHQYFILRLLIFYPVFCFKQAAYNKRIAMFK